MGATPGRRAARGHPGGAQRRHALRAPWRNCGTTRTRNPTALARHQRRRDRRWRSMGETRGCGAPSRPPRNGRAEREAPTQRHPHAHRRRDRDNPDRGRHPPGTRCRGDRAARRSCGDRNAPRDQDVHRTRTRVSEDRNGDRAPAPARAGVALGGCEQAQDFVAGQPLGDRLTTMES